MKSADFKTPIRWPRSNFRLARVDIADGFTLEVVNTGLVIRATEDVVFVPWTNVQDSRTTRRLDARRQEEN